MALDLGNVWNLATALALLVLSIALGARWPAHAITFAGLGLFAAGLSLPRLALAAEDGSVWLRLAGGTLVVLGGGWALARARDIVAALLGVAFLVATLAIVGLPSAAPSQGAYVLFRGGLALACGAMLADIRRGEPALALALSTYFGYLIGTNFYEAEPGRLQLGVVGAVAMLVLTVALLRRAASPVVAWLPLLAALGGMLIGALPGRPEEVGGGGFARAAAILVALPALASRLDPRAPAVLLYDGDCGFCTRGVLFSFERDPRGRLRYASLQSEVGQKLLSEHGIPGDLKTVVLIDEKGAHVRSTAALRTARLLRWPWSWCYVAIVVPRPLRDAVYRLVAKHRHRFGPAAAKRGADASADASSAVEACRMPSPELRARMIDR